jgi:predicted  nucleic acid-binding Zn-ribbon protein
MRICTEHNSEIAYDDSKLNATCPACDEIEQLKCEIRAIEEQIGRLEDEHHELRDEISNLEDKNRQIKRIFEETLGKINHVD